ncbi:FCD domain-containing protein [Streptomyces sp. E5N91]|uniref:FadR/GntR family transcriptional regulator n=1 Tax=Streptomyces sp. E5N91 TaxID=1851996 RepID=UPI000EF61D8A|nr:FCD domain-containing protein [Streptomyces sp. E5N91]
MNDREPRRTTVPQQAVEEIKAMIARGEPAVGERLPTERELAASLGISRGSVREAIRALTALGTLESRQGSGVYVTAQGGGEIRAALGAVADVSQGRQLRELLEIRRILESAAAGIAAARITESQLTEAAEHMTAMSDTDDLERLLGHDLAFHEVIVRAAGNETLAGLVEGLSTRTLRARLYRGHRDAGALVRTRQEHARILRALAARDPEAARAATAAHICGVEDWFAERSGQGGLPVTE